MITNDISGLAEQLQRIEHKLDLILEHQAKSDPTMVLRSLGDQEHACPLCHQQVMHQLDIFRGHVMRRCSCNTGVSPLLNLNQDTELPNGTPSD